jgi:pyruvate dehydrogenase E1 component alpha subunit
MPGRTVDGNDAISIYKTMQEYILQARNGEGPSLIECMTYRHGGHHVNDPGLYMSEDVLKEWMARDPIKRLEEYLMNSGVDQSEIDAINSQVEKEIETAIEFALDSPEPSLEDFLIEIEHM